MRQFRDIVTSQLADPWAHIGSLTLSRRPPTDGLGQEFAVSIYPPFDLSNSDAFDQRLDIWMRDFSPDQLNRIHARVASRINATTNMPAQVPGREGTSVSPLHANTALLNGRGSRVRDEDQLRQARTRESPTTSAPQSNAALVPGAQQQPSASLGQAATAVPQVARPSVEENASQQLTAGASSNVDVNPPHPSSNQTGATDEAPKPAASKTNTGTSKKGAANGRKGSGIASSGAGTGERNTLQAGSLNTTQAKPKTDKKPNKVAGRKNNSSRYDVDNDPERERFPGYTNLLNSPPPVDFEYGDPEAPLRKPRQSKKVGRANSEATSETVRSTSKQANNRGRTRSGPLATPLVSTNTSRAPKLSAKRKAFDDLENDRSDDDDKRAKKPTRVKALNNIEEESEENADASSSLSEEDDDDGHGTQIRNRKSSSSSEDGNASQKAPGARQNAGLSASQTARSNKGQRVESQNRQNAQSAKTRARDPHSQQGNTDNNGTQEVFSEIEVAEAADTLLQSMGSDSERSAEPEIPDDQFEQSFASYTNPGPADQDDQEDGYQDMWDHVDGLTARRPSEAHRFGKRPQSIIKSNNSRRPTIALGNRHRNSLTSWPGASAIDDDNDGIETTLLTKADKKRKTNPDIRTDEADGESKASQAQKKTIMTYIADEEEEIQPPQKKLKLNLNKTKMGQATKISSESLVMHVTK